MAYRHQSLAVLRRLCCLCGLSIQPNPSNMCVNCLRSQVDITEGVQKSVSSLHVALNVALSLAAFTPVQLHEVCAEEASHTLTSYDATAS